MMQFVHRDAFKRNILVTDFQFLVPQIHEKCNSFDELELPEPIRESIMQKRIQNPTNLQRVLLPLLFKDPDTDILIESPRKEGMTTSIAIATSTIVFDLLQAGCTSNSTMSPSVIVVFENQFKVNNGYNVFSSLLSSTSITCVKVDSVDESDTLCHILLTTPVILRNLIDSKRLNCQSLACVVIESGDYIMNSYGIPKTCKLMDDLYKLGSKPMRIFTAYRIYDSRREELHTILRQKTFYVRALLF